MNYYEVQVASRAYHSKGALTYQSPEVLEPGQIVTVPLRNKKVLAFVIRKVSQPEFKARDIIAISQNPPLPQESIELHAWIEEYYPSRSGSTLQLFLPSTISKDSRKTTAATTKPTIKHSEEKLPPLTKEQASTLDSILKSSAKSFLIHGETGSGKTRLYAELSRHTLGQKRSVMILTPEIGLTTQLAQEIERFLSHKIYLLHSQLTPKQRRDIWQAISRSEDPVIIIGTRSALFAPVRNLGLIVIDEAHDDAYKQEQAPHYLASRVAAQLAKLHNAQLVLGSATPTVTEYSLFEQKGLPIIAMKSQARAASEVDYEIIDLTKRDNFSKSNYISNQLIKQLTEALSNKEQSLVYLNRRGTARLVMCQQCGWESKCPRCDIALTFHADEHRLLCHTCGLKEQPPSACPECKSADIFYKSIGTKALITHLNQLFPEARIERFDTDQQKDKRLEVRYNAIRKGEVDILVGTQMLGKGLDLPLLRVIGVIQADTSLLIPDFSAREKTYQQLHQIIGRVGRGHRKGFIVVQTHNPDSSLIKHALNRDYTAFLRKELEERQTYLYPPYCYLLKLSTSRKTAESADRSAQELKEVVINLQLPVKIIGPSPAFKSKTHGNYHWQIIVKAKHRTHLLRIIDNLPKTAAYNIDPVNLL